MSAVPAPFLQQARSLQDQMVELRRSLHTCPEIGLHLPETQRSIDAAISDLGLDVRLGEGLSSLVAVIRGDHDGPSVLLRADMDALPVEEATELDYASEVPGAMHACGHDLHSAMLVGAAHVLAARRTELAGSVILAWQPGEEGYDGMQLMLEEGLLNAAGNKPLATYGLHVLAGTLPHGVFGTRDGASHASTAQFTVTVRGTGGHAAFPHACADPVPVAAEIVTALQTRITRGFDVFDPVIATVGSLRAGSTANVIPTDAILTGTARAFSHGNAGRLPRVVEELAHGVASAHGMTAEVSYQAGYPAVVNDAAEVSRIRATVEELYGTDRYQPLRDPIPAGDDFARVLQTVPGAFVMLGAGLPSDRDGQVHPNHSSQSLFDDSLLAEGAAVIAEAALRRLAEHAKETVR